MKNQKLPIVLLLVAGWIIGGQNLSGQPVQQKVPTIHLDNIPLTVAIDNLGRTADLNFTIDPRIVRAGDSNTAAPVSVRWENMTAKEALTRLLKERGLFLVENPQTGVAKITVTNAPPRVFDKEFLESSQEVIPVVQMMEVPLGMALAQLGKQAGMQFQFDSAVTNSSKAFQREVNISMRFEKLTAAQAVAAICDNQNLQIAKSDKAGSWIISPVK